MHRIGKAAKNTACSCPHGEITACKKKVLKPQIYIEEPHRLPVPIVIKPYTDKPTTVQVFDGQSRWNSRRSKASEETPNKFCQWYTKRRALKELKTLHKREKKRDREYRLEKARLERENEFFDQVKQARREKEYLEQLKHHRSKSLPPPKIERKKHLKGRSTSVKPRAMSRYVTVARHNHRESLSNRCVNCFYRFCCQFYCYLTCIIILTLVVILII